MPTDVIYIHLNILVLTKDNVRMIFVYALLKISVEKHNQGEGRKGEQMAAWHTGTDTIYRNF